MPSTFTTTHKYNKDFLKTWSSLAEICGGDMFEMLLKHYKADTDSIVVDGITMVQYLQRGQVNAGLLIRKEVILVAHEFFCTREQRKEFWAKQHQLQQQLITG